MYSNRICRAHGLDAKRLTAQLTGVKDMLDGIHTAPGVNEPASQLRPSAHTRHREKLLPDEGIVKTEILKFWADMQARIDWIQALLDDKMKRANAFDGEPVRSVIFEKGLERQLQLWSKDSEVADNLNYWLGYAVSQKCRFWTTIEFLQQQLLSTHFNVHEHRQYLPLSTERFMADVTDGLRCSLYSITTEVKTLVNKQSKDVQTTVETDLEAIDAFLGGAYRNLSLPVPSSQNL